MKRIVSAFLCLVVLLSALSGCATTYKSNNGKTVANVGDFEISYDLVYYFYKMYEKESKDAGAERTKQQLAEMVEQTLMEIATVVILAEKQEIEVSDEDIDEIHRYIKDVKGGYKSDEEFYADLEANFMSEQVMYDVAYYAAVEEALRTTFLNGLVISDKELNKALEEEFMAAVNIVIFKSHKEDGMDALELAQSIHDRIEAGESIRDLAAKYSDDSYIGDRYFAPGTNQKYFEDKVASLQVGELSEVYESDYGYNITERIAIDSEFVAKYYEDLREELAYSRYLARMDQAMKELSFKYSTDFDWSAIN